MSNIRWDVPIPQAQAVDGGSERTIEIPLALEWLALNKSGIVLDAGCAVRKKMPKDTTANVVCVTMNMNDEPFTVSQNRGGVSWDLRDLHLVFAPRCFRATVCVSTLEHVGMDNKGYGGTTEHDPESKWRAVDALKVVTYGPVFLTVPWQDDPQPMESAKWMPWSLKEIRDLGGEARYYARSERGWWGGTDNPVRGDRGIVQQIACVVI